MAVIRKTNFLIAGLMFIVFFSAKGQVVKVPFTLEKWDTLTLQTEDTTRVRFVQDRWLGKECIRLESGAIVLKDVNLRDGSIEADISFPKVRNFPGFAVRMQDMNNFESFYLRPHQSGNPDATQYTPQFNGQTGFQLYYGEGYDGAYSFRFDQWHHIKIDLHGLSAEFYIDDSAVIKVKELLTGWKAGKISIATNAPLRIANFQYNVRYETVPVPLPVPANGEGGVITHWQISNLVHSSLFKTKNRLGPEIKRSLTWETQTTEPSGTINLARFGGTPIDTGRTIVARLLVESASDQLKELSFGFSDYIKIYLNDHVLYYGADRQYSRDYRFLGTIGYFDRLFLPLKKGINELWLVVSEDFGGWGFKAKFENMDNISLK